MEEVRQVWGEELGRFVGEDIRLALEAMRFAYKDYPPTLFQFADLCRDAARSRSQTTAKVEHVRYGQAAPEVLAAIHELTKDPLKRKRDPRDWARRILKRDQEGEKLPIMALTAAREALGVA